MYEIKKNEEYADVIRKTNKNKAFMVVWHDEFAPTKYIGHNNSLYDKYGIEGLYTSGASVDDCVKAYIGQYLNDGPPDFSYTATKNGTPHQYHYMGRSESNLMDMAEHLVRRCAELHIDETNPYYKDVDKMADVIIGHACYETVLGGLCELRVRKYLTSMGCNTETLLSESDEAWLDKGGCDIFLSDKDNTIYGFVQVKPLSFLFGKGSDLVADRAKCYGNEDKLREFASRHPQYFRAENNGGVDFHIRYIVYDKARGYNFIKFPIGGRDRLFIKVGDFTDRDGKSLLRSADVGKYATDDLTKINKI